MLQLTVFKSKKVMWMHNKWQTKVWCQGNKSQRFSKWQEKGLRRSKTKIYFMFLHHLYVKYRMRDMSSWVRMKKLPPKTQKKGMNALFSYRSTLWRLQSKLSQWTHLITVHY